MPIVSYRKGEHLVTKFELNLCHRQSCDAQSPSTKLELVESSSSPVLAVLLASRSTSIGDNSGVDLR